jgi:multidrug efflux pump subunit AcrA (membrane-fusion protein)
MRWTVLCIVAAAGLGRLEAAEYPLSPAKVNVPHCVVALAEQADLPPLEAGVIKEVAVKDGDKVEEKQLLLQLDDSKAQAELNVAQAKQEAAETKFKAADINVEYAKAAKDVAVAEYETNLKANTKVPGSVPAVQLNTLLLKCTETRLAIVKADSDKKVAEEEANVARAEVAAAKVMVDRHKVLSPIAGEVVEIRAHKGEAVQPAQPAILVVKLDSVWVQGRVPAAEVARAAIGKNVTVDVTITRREKRSFPGQVIFVNPLTDTGDTYVVRAKVTNQQSNGYWLLSPGMQAEMSVELTK